MEKIQSAIAKARATRDAKTEGPRQPGQRAEHVSLLDTVVSQPSHKELIAAWEVLPFMETKHRLLKKNRIVAVDSGREATAIDMMRTRVLQQMRDNNWRRLAVTSPTAACGKSTIALNLALSLQRQLNLRTMLMEIDMRRPSLARMSGIDKAINFAHVLEGSSSFEDNAVRYAPNLAISSVQTPHRNAAELLNSPSVPEALAAIEDKYAPDIMLFDTPPMLATDDMMSFARHVDCVLLIAGAESSTIKEIDLCETDLATQTNIMGVVLNKCRYMGPEYGYGYYD